MNKLAFILELIWLALALFCLGMGIWATYKGLSNSYMFFVMAVVALLMYFLRRSRRKKMENQ
ncbi:hypothetical protein [Tenuifilum sp.]|uniref:hypothetical protein n=1 Tax=Tenuifilum sp. TaxID=2760880 RepID=UPI002B7F432E|nr:hypothetical protein [Tenuifilum sp.]HOK85458.1 hypothetical protein [Tenuifilum sp.]HON70944.1 hypothetical protein [Tenuifilum sp.]HPP90915.1 hypothetical protein [Tenuifilum sp.]HQI89815.1 hypothetical protein [Tenuifilum sp.]